VKLQLPWLHFLSSLHQLDLGRLQFTYRKDDLAYHKDDLAVHLAHQQRPLSLDLTSILSPSIFLSLQFLHLLLLFQLRAMQLFLYCQPFVVPRQQEPELPI